MTYLTFIEQKPVLPRKTKIWAVLQATSGNFLGRISWRSGWRRYTFAPDATAVFDAACLREIVVFMDTEMLRYRG